MTGRRTGILLAFATACISGVAVWVNGHAVSHFTPEHFREHFVDASRGTLAEGAEVDATLATSIDDPKAAGVVLESVEVEVP